MFIAKPIAHDEAAAAIAGKPAVVRAVFDQLLPELKGLAFTVTGVQDANVLQRIRDRIADLPRGGDWDAIKKDVVAELSPFLVDDAAEPEVKDAQIKAAARRAELLLRTHGYQAYQATAYRQMVESSAYLPYWKYLTVRDDQVRDSHRALHGLILPWDHPFWQDHFPPWDWGCRCQVIATTDREYEQAKTSPTDQAWTLGPEAQKRLADGVLDKGDGHPVNVPSPRLRAMRARLDPNTAYAWRPGDVGIPIDQIKARYDDKTWAAVGKIFEPSFAKASAGRQKGTEDTETRLPKAVTVDGGDVPEPVKTVNKDDAIDRLKAAGASKVSVEIGEVLPEASVKRLEEAIRWLRERNLPIPVQITFDSAMTKELAKKELEKAVLVYNPEVDVVYVDAIHYLLINDGVIITAKNKGNISTDNPHHHFLHESAHPLHWFAARTSFNMTLTNEQRAIAYAFVSKRAAMNAAEFVAEVYAALKSGRTFPPESRVMDVYAKLGGPR
ncbi:MAG TPA: phage minor head protein [Kiritimatiellia bacterium]|nr:phage minor head protein [Kiritimatiellia bacterium]HMP33200.1 phage minor head protein [Kiritimatiellia bacterium]